MREPIWVRDDVVAAIHNRQLAEHGGASGVRDQGLLQSALARPRNLFSYSGANCDLASLAAAYGFGIIKNHPFFDGNKRAAYVTCRLFLQLNAHDIQASQEEKYVTFNALAEGRLGEEEFATWIRDHLARTEANKDPGSRS